MNKSYFKYIINSISVKLICLIACTVGPIAGLMFYNNVNSRQILLEQIVDTHHNMLSNYIIQLDDELSSAMAYALNLVLNENDAQILAFSNSHAEKQYATVRLKNDLSVNLLSHSFMDGFFILTNPNDESEIFINTSNSQHIATPNKVLNEYVKEYIEEERQLAQWNICRFNDDDYLFMMASVEDGLYAGSYVRISHLLSQFEPSSISGSSILLFSEDSLREYESDLSVNTQLVTCHSTHAGLTMVEAFSREPILDSLPFLQKYTIAISIAMVALIILLFFMTQEIVIKPLFKLASAMQHIQDSDLEYRLPPENSSSELRLVNETFNHMASQIKNLKINVYEEQIKVQKSQLRNLQMQIKPHFLINSLNMIHDLNNTGKVSLANKLILHTIAYFRYMIRVDEDLVPLTEEIDHIKAYLDIQAIRYKNHFQYAIYVDPLIEDVLVPPVILQGFVENSIKYALDLKEILQITVRVTSFEMDYFPYVKIQMSDSGLGYPLQELEILNLGGKIIKKDGEHIGIRNTVQRLRFIFGKKVSIRFYNDNGAACEYIFPATFLENEEDEEDM